MSKILLVDFGASRIKSIVWDVEMDLVLDSIECKSPQPSFGAVGEVEVDPEQYWEALEATAGRLLEVNPEVINMWICSEMHGVLLLNKSTNSPLTPYISWRDERASKSIGDHPSTFTQFDESFKLNFLRVTGLKFRVGLPFLTLAHLKVKLTSTTKVCTLVDWLLYRGGEKDPKIVPSLAAGTGFFSLDTKEWPSQISSLSVLNMNKEHLSTLSADKKLIGTINLKGRTIKVYGGIGDLQAAVLGAGFPKKSPLLVNLGTGSQVIGITENTRPDVELRPDANGGTFSALSHIPAGRALNVFAQFIDSCSISGGGKPIFWEIFQSLQVREILDSRLTVDLNVFEASWLYKDGGVISGILEAGFNARAFIAGLAKSWLNQYVLAMNMIDHNKNLKTFLVSGGLSRRGQFILPVLEQLSGRAGSLVSLITGEETLDGLLSLALSSHDA